MKMLFLTSSLGGYQKILKNGIMVKEIIKCEIQATLLIN